MKRNISLKRGINLGGYLSQCNHTKERYDTFIVESDIETIAGWGLDHVRLPIDYEVFEDEAGNERPAGYQYVKNVIEWSKKNGLNIVLDLHKAYGYDFNDAGNSEKNNLFTSEPLQERFINLWKKIAKSYCAYDHVVFELLNEVVEEENADLWNALIKKSVAAIREITKDTPIIYGGIQWNSAKTLKYLEKPNDENIIFTFHFYEPILFTHQKAFWMPLMDKEKDIFYPKTMEYFVEESKVLGYQGAAVGSVNAKTMGPEFMELMILEAIDAAQKAGVELYCGEFGVIDQAPVEDTLRWFKDVDEVFRKHNINCAVWSYKEMDFGLIDEHYKDIKDDIIALWTK